MSLLDKHYIEQLHPRGISPEYAYSHERYVSYSPEDVDRLVAQYDFGKAQSRSSRVRTVQEGPGLLIARSGPTKAIRDFAVDLGGVFWNEVPQPASQLRPDVPGKRSSKYQFLEGDAKAVDVHPMAVPALKQRGDKVALFFILEGSMKADAALSENWLAVNVSAVTHWQSPDIQRRLTGTKMKKGPVTFVVTDSDWATNEKVYNQALACTTWMRGMGIPAVHLAPKALAGLSKTGLDDIIATENFGMLEDLLIVPRRPEYAPAAATGSARVLYEYLLACREREVQAIPALLSMATGLTKNEVRNATRQLVEMGKLVVIHGSRYKDPETGRWENNLHRYQLVLPDPMPLSAVFAEAGVEDWQGYLLSVSPQGAETRAVRRVGLKALDVAGRSTDTRLTCEGPGCTNALVRKRSTGRFCSDRCRKAHRRMSA